MAEPAELFDLIENAAEKLSSVIRPTPLVYSSTLSKMFDFECYLKCENLQKTGSFKVRGAYNRISALTRAEHKRGVVAASSGNHAQGVAWASTLLGVRSRIVMPEGSSIVKYMATRGYGAEVLFHGTDFAGAYAHALRLAEKDGYVFIPPYDDELVMAGQGTIGVEITEALDGVDAVVVPVGGGGLISGIAAAVKNVRPDIAVIGVEPENSNSCELSLRAGRPVEAPERPTLADGVAVKTVGEKTFPVIREYVDRVVTVNEDTIAAAILLLLERKKLMVEGAGAVPLAAAMEGRLTGLEGARVVLVLSGGNIDVTTMDRVLKRGLIREGRVASFPVTITDVPGSLAMLAAVIAAEKANILQMVHRRDAAAVPVGSVRLEIIIEVEGPEHRERVFSAMRENGYEV